MICYKDTTFCSNPKCEGKCGRQFTEEERKGAEAWWGGPGAPVAFSDFCGRLGHAPACENEREAIQAKLRPPA